MPVIYKTTWRARQTPAGCTTLCCVSSYLPPPGTRALGGHMQMLYRCIDCLMHQLTWLTIMTRLPSKTTAGTTFTLLHAALTVFTQWTHLAAVMAATAECLAGILRFVTTGEPRQSLDP